MVKKIKFALRMADGYKVRSLEDLREHFDLEKVIGYFLDGKLEAWLMDRHYDTEAEALQELDTTATDFSYSLCAVLGKEYKNVAEVDIGAVVRLNQKCAYLKQRTDDVNILAHVAQVALTQEDIVDLLADGIREVYLCGEVFVIPLRVEHCYYRGILGTPEIRLAAKSVEELEARDIVLENVLLPDLLREAEPRTESDVLENHKQHKSYQVSKLLDCQISDKDRAVASKMYDVAQKILGSFVFDIDVGSRPLEEAARSMDLPGAWQTYLSRMA